MHLDPCSRPGGASTLERSGMNPGACLQQGKNTMARGNQSVITGREQEERESNILKSDNCMSDIGGLCVNLKRARKLWVHAKQQTSGDLVCAVRVGGPYV